jgi:hypothetical protein
VIKSTVRKWGDLSCINSVRHESATGQWRLPKEEVAAKRANTDESLIKNIMNKIEGFGVEKSSEIQKPYIYFFLVVSLSGFFCRGLYQA